MKTYKHQSALIAEDEATRGSNLMFESKDKSGQKEEMCAWWKFNFHRTGSLAEVFCNS